MMMQIQLGYTHTDQNLRPRQEDRFFNDVPVVGKARLFGIFDGHGMLGGQVADVCVSAFPFFMRSYYHTNTDMVETFFKTFQSVDDQVRTLALQTPHLSATGSTAILTFVSPAGIWMANAGDSLGIIVLDDGECRMITKEHKVSAPEEMARIQSGGGEITYDDVNNPATARICGLNVSRGIGDLYAKKFFIPRPDIRSISPSLYAHVRYVIMASDGLWDVMRERDVQDMIRPILEDPKQITRGLVEVAKKRGSTDNITVSIIDIRAYRKSGSIL